jgi:hypothetical protein
MTNSDPLSGDQRSSADIGAEDIGPEQIEERASCCRRSAPSAATTRSARPR